MNTNLQTEPLTVRTDLKAGTYWTSVPNLTKKNKQYSCPAACPSGWTGGAILGDPGSCECN